jgi:hypothetical protein
MVKSGRCLSRPTRTYDDDVALAIDSSRPLRSRAEQQALDRAVFEPTLSQDRRGPLADVTQQRRSV